MMKAKSLKKLLVIKEMFLAANFPSIQPRRQPRTYFFNHW